MIVFGAFTYQSDTQVASQLIVGGVSLITIFLTAYTAFATLDDRWHWTKTEEMVYGDAMPDDESMYDGDSIKPYKPGPLQIFLKDPDENSDLHNRPE